MFLHLFDKYLNRKDDTIANAALIGLSLELRNHPLLQNRFDLEKRIQLALQQSEELISEEQKTYKIQAILEAIGNARAENFYHILNEQLHSKNQTIQNTAILSSAKTLDKIFILLIRFSSRYF